ASKLKTSLSSLNGFQATNLSCLRSLFVILLCQFSQMTTRRDFITATAGALASAPGRITAATAEPWYRRTCRWGQTNITEKDPVRYDIPWWREFWKRTRVQGVIINAGGIVAYYPSKYPLQHRAEFLGDRDLYGDLAKAAH